VAEEETTAADSLPPNSSAVAALVEILAARRLRVSWFERWHADLEGALRELPEMPTCPHELYRQLIETPGILPKRVALVTEHDTPVAVIGLRREPTQWLPVTSWVAPGSIAPHRTGYLVAAFAALRMPVKVAWWHESEPPPVGACLQVSARIPTHKLTCEGDFEAYWRQSGQMKHILRARKKCAAFQVVVNHPGANEWAINGAGRKWAPPGLAWIPGMRDKLTAARYWEPRQRLISVSLLDGERIAASANGFALGRELVGLTNYREPEYDRLGVGHRVFDALLWCARERGFEKLDFGGGHEYKSGYAPEDGARWQLTFAPDGIEALRVGRALLTHMRRLVASRASG
jgi:hypothetical protein